MNMLNDFSYGRVPVEFSEHRVDLSSMLTGCGYSFENSADYRWHGLKRGVFEFAIWQYTISGHGRLEFEGRSYDLKKGDAMVIYVPQDSLYYIPEESDGWEFIYLEMNGNEIMRIWHKLTNITGPVVNLQENSQALLMAYNIYKRAAGKKILSAFEASSLAYTFVMDLSNELLGNYNYTGKLPELIERVRTYTVNHLHENIGVDDLANIAGYSRFHFSRTFKKLYGISPSAFLNNMRMRRAVRLLQTELITVKEVADKCGFPDASYFCKVFRKEFNVSPEVFRNGK
jgi:AraC-like DNA-binding protein